MNVLPINKSRSTAATITGDDRYMSALPFENNFDSRFYFASSMHEEAMSRLLYLAEDGNFMFGMLSGACGSGKSYLRNLLHKRLDKQHYLCVAIESPLLDLDGIMLEVISQARGIRLSTTELPDRYSRLAEFKKCLHEEIAATGKHMIMSIDEAHLLDNVTLEGLRLLSNITAPLQNLFTILLIGQPELEQKLNADPALEQRTGLRIRLAAMDSEASGLYVKHRMQLSGIADKLDLSPQMCASLFMFTGGIPRRINTLLKLSIEFARINNRNIDDAVVAAVIGDQAGKNDIIPHTDQGIRHD